MLSLASGPLTRSPALGVSLGAALLVLLACGGDPGWITVEDHSTGEDLDPNGYTVRVLQVSQHLDVNGSVTFKDVAPLEPGYDVTLDGAAQNCSPPDSVIVSVGAFGSEQQVNRRVRITVIQAPVYAGNITTVRYYLSCNDIVGEPHDPPLPPAEFVPPEE